MPEINELLFSPEVLEKLLRDHQLTQWEVEDVVYAPESEPRWDVDPAHGAE